MWMWRMDSAMAAVRKPVDPSEGSSMKKIFGRLKILFVLCLFMMPMRAQAASTTGEMAQYPNITLSPDGSERAWTTDYGDQTDENLPEGYTISMDAESSLRELDKGEHYYKKAAEGSVRVGKWVVMHSPGECIHETPDHDTFAGFSFRDANCLTTYNNGWFAYCADCEEEIAHMLIYAKRDTVCQITSMPASSIYVYLCPYCNHLEQGVNYSHLCTGVSSNRYRVTYRPNAPEGAEVHGYMMPTKHMYDNSTYYNGSVAEEIGYTDTALRENSYYCEGYTFAGWNLAPDGSGTAYVDGQEVLNLTDEDNGTVKLYAQWVKAESTLVLDAAGGTYQGKAVHEQTQGYGSTYTINASLVTAPAGYQVRFESNGGSAVAAIRTTRSFYEWVKQPGFQGTLKEAVYTFDAADGTRDTLKASYLNNTFVLPGCSKTNYSLAGWYDSSSLTDSSFVGKPGDQVTVDGDTVLYAKWATLTLWAADDYTSYSGSGAVDLTWEQKDGKSKYYRLYQSQDKSSWNEIFSGSDIKSSVSVSKTYGTGNQGTTYQITYTGNYTITAYGAKGADYNSTYTGGKGGSAAATFWLRKGDVITVYPGTAGSSVNGGINGNGNNGGTSPTSLGRGGGAATQVYLTRSGTKTLLITAGGGGGANAGNKGGNGGSGGGNTNGAGVNGVGAGGGGYAGGTCGEFTYHTHVNACNYHTHAGDTVNGGACYSQTTCGGALEQTDQREIGGWYGHYDTDGSGICVQCGYNFGLYGNEEQGHAWYTGNDEWTCRKCGNVTDSDTGTCRRITYYMSCTLSVGWQCGKTTSTVEGYKASNGGTSYVSTGFGSKNVKKTAGANNGAGKVTLVSVDIGYTDLTALNNVVAKDKAAPGAIQEYDSALCAEDICRITVLKPADNGTLYYHKAESYQDGTLTKLSTSNITANTLVSGIAGYRYYVDAKASGTVTTSHTWTAADTVDIAMKDAKQYLHIAAVDVAGNMGPVKHILIEAKSGSSDAEINDDYVEDVPLKTEQMSVAASDYVYAVDGKTYYVRADGETEHTLQVAGYVDGKATNRYQVDWLQLESSADTVAEWYRIRIPKADVTAGDKTFLDKNMVSGASGEDLLLLDYTSAQALRSHQAARVSLMQKFVSGPENDGKQILLYPRAVAELNDKEFISDVTADRGNAITLIPDALAPVTEGIDELEAAGNINMTDENVEFVIKATDTGSGIRNLTVTVINQDNLMTRTYSSDTGDVTITMTKDDYLFQGDFGVTAKATDNVGNTSIRESDNLAFSLKAELKRARYPHNGDFKAGDGAVLTITTGGYADKVIVRFLDELLALNPELDKEYVYEFPEVIKTEMYEFNIPLGTPSGNYKIEVEAWKNGRKLTEQLQLPVRTAGSIIEEFRTRIRDNGV